MLSAIRGALRIATGYQACKSNPMEITDMDNNKGTGITAVKAASSQPTIAELQARIAELEAQQANGSKLTFKVSEKGGVSVYGLGRFPVTNYRKGWLRILDAADELRAFIKANDSKLSTGKEDVRFKVADKEPETGANGQQTANGATPAASAAA